MLKKIIRNIFSRPFFQAFFEVLLSITLKVLNIGDGHSAETSGEDSVPKFLNLKLKNKKITVFDVGAHDGEWYTMFKSNYLGDMTVYAFEPSSKSFERLLKYKSDNFKPENIALGSQVGEMLLESGAPGDSTAHLVSRTDSLNNSEPYLEGVTVDTIDNYLQNNSINFIDLLKMDVEGYELKVLQGAKMAIESKKIGMIQFEFGAPSMEKYMLKDFFDILCPQYNIYRVLKNGIYKIKQYSHIYEIHSVTNFIAIKK